MQRLPDGALAIQAEFAGVGSSKQPRSTCSMLSFLKQKFEGSQFRPFCTSLVELCQLVIEATCPSQALQRYALPPLRVSVLMQDSTYYLHCLCLVASLPNLSDEHWLAGVPHNLRSPAGPEQHFSSLLCGVDNARPCHCASRAQFVNELGGCLARFLHARCRFSDIARPCPSGISTEHPCKQHFALACTVNGGMKYMLRLPCPTERKA